ncbi:MAG TPA: transglycosylase domain-containing protein [Trebonia sp.]|nr:transglycosylase domain-containing protein [Trebonia sp.]
MDANYETNMQQAVRPDVSHPEPGYSYWTDGHGWHSKPGPGGAPVPAAPAQGPAAPVSDATSLDAMRAVSDATSLDATRAVPDATSLDATRAVFGAGPGIPAGPGAGGYGAPMGPGGPGGYGPGGPDWAGGPGGPAWPGGPMGPGGPGGPGGPRRPPGPGGKRKGDWWRRWTWKKALAVTGGVFVLLFLVMFSTYQYLYSTTTIPAALASETAQSSTVYYSDGTTVMGTIGTTNRKDLQLNQIPLMLQDAYLAAEDKNFWTEGGVSYTGILRAGLHDLTSGSGLNGGSTITQEFVRNYYGLGLQQTVSRKVKEVFISEKLAHTKSKQWILQHYLNAVQEGDNAYGVEAAAETYFGVPVSQLTISQDAIIASMPQAPSALPQVSNKAGLQYRWNYVLGEMVKDGFITQAQMNAQKFPTLLTWNDPARAETAADINPANPNSDPWEPYILDAVVNELTGLDNLTQAGLNSSGYKIVTAISLPMEKEMYNAVDTTLSSSSLQSAPGSAVSSRPSWAHVGAELQDPKTGAILAMYPGPGQNMSAKQCTLWDCADNTALYTREQVGSSFKPYVLSAAVQEGMDVQTTIMNTSPYVCIAPDGSSQYSVPITAAEYTADSLLKPPSCQIPGGLPIENDSGELIGKQVGQQSSGPQKGAYYYSDDVQNALAMSSNTGFTDLAHRASTKSIIQMAQAYGVNIASYQQGGSNLSQMVGQVGLALGTASLTVNEQATMLATIDNGGIYHAAHIVKYWQSGNGAEQKPVVNTHQVLTQAEDSQVQYAMEATTLPGGTAYGSVTLNRPLISKTGTTNGEHNGFYIGAIPQYALAVGMFTNINGSNTLFQLGGGGVGGYWPARIWNAFATTEFNNLPVQQMLTPQFSGAKWNMLGPLPKATPVCTQTVHGHKVATHASGCPAATPTPTPSTTTCSNNQFGNPACTGTGNGKGNGKGGGNASSPTPTATATATCQFPTCTPGQTPTSTSPAPTKGSGNGGGTLGGTLAVPGTLLMTEAARRRKRRNRRRKAE